MLTRDCRKNQWTKVSRCSKAVFKRNKRNSKKANPQKAAMIQVHFENIRQQILQELEEAQSNIVVAVYWFTNLQLFDKLLQKQKKGISVKVIIHNDYINNRSTGLPFQQLIESGGEFYFSDEQNPMHNKFCIIDEKVLVNGSYNWTYYAENKNRENILVIKNEESIVTAFVDEFKRLVQMLIPQRKIEPLTNFEAHENNHLNTKEYLAHDLLFQAKATNHPELVKKAFELAPENVNVQRVANQLDLIKKYRLKHSVVVSLVNDDIKCIALKGALLPATFSTVIRTASNYQPISQTDILYGEHNKASKNTLIKSMQLGGLPLKPAGQAKVKLVFTLNIRGQMRIEKMSLDTGKKEEWTQDASWLVEEVSNIEH
jgi:hypothetical protein